MHTTPRLLNQRFLDLGISPLFLNSPLTWDEECVCPRKAPYTHARTHTHTHTQTYHTHKHNRHTHTPHTHTQRHTHTTHTHKHTTHTHARTHTHTQILKCSIIITTQCTKKMHKCTTVDCPINVDLLIHMKLKVWLCWHINACVLINHSLFLWTAT